MSSACPPVARHNLFVVHSWDEVGAYTRMKELLSSHESGLADYSVPPWKALEGPADVVAASLDSRIQTASAVVVMNTPGLHRRPTSTYEMQRSVEMGKRIIVLQPHGAFDHPIPQVLDGSIYRVASWRGDVLGRAIRGEYPHDGRVFDIAEVAERRTLVGGVAAVLGVASFLVAGATVGRLKALSDELAARGMRLDWTGAETAQVLGPAVGGAIVAGLLTALITRDAKSAGLAALAGAGAGATYGLVTVYRARLVGTKNLRTITLEME